MFVSQNRGKEIQSCLIHLYFYDQQQQQQQNNNEMISGIVVIIIIMLTKHPRHGFLVFGKLYMIHCECKPPFVKSNEHCPLFHRTLSEFIALA